MFAPTFFAPRYFPPTYFPVGSDFVPPKPPYGGTFRRGDRLARVFARLTAPRTFGRRGEVGRTFRRNWPMAETIPYQTIPFPKSELGLTLVFDFSNFPEAQSGETLASATVAGFNQGGLPAGVTAGSVAVLAAEFDDVPAGLGVSFVLGGTLTVGAEIEVEAKATFTGGGPRVVRGLIAVC